MRSRIFLWNVQSPITGNNITLAVVAENLRSARVAAAVLVSQTEHAVWWSSATDLVEPAVLENTLQVLAHMPDGTLDTMTLKQLFSLLPIQILKNLERDFKGQEDIPMQAIHDMIRAYCDVSGPLAPGEGIFGYGTELDNL